MLELCVIWILFERRYRYSIVKLFAKRINSVVNNDNVAERYISEDAQVLNVNVISCLNALVSVKAVLNQFTRGVDVVQNCICVAWI